MYTNYIFITHNKYTPVQTATDARGVPRRRYKNGKKKNKNVRI